jgi:glycosyltransferase involved in cell wall biosynthesis
MQTIYVSDKEHANSIQVVDLETKPVVSIVLPAYNEAETIRDVVIDYYEEIANKLPSKLIVAEDGSIDPTPQILASLANEVPLSLFSERIRKGYAKGVADAIKKCQAEWVFFSDSDGQYFPSDFWKLWENRYGYDMIIGRKVSRSEGIHRTILSKGFHCLFNTLFGLNLHDADCGFRLIRKDVVQSVVEEAKLLKYSFWAEFTIRACLKGFMVREVPISHASRPNGGTRIYSPSKIPVIVLKQLKDLARLYTNLRGR